MTKFERMAKRKDEAETMAVKMYRKGESDLARFWNNVAKWRAEKTRSMTVEEAGKER